MLIKRRISNPYLQSEDHDDDLVRSSDDADDVMQNDGRELNKDEF
jgi:hypothetical protein